METCQPTAAARQHHQTSPTLPLRPQFPSCRSLVLPSKGFSHDPCCTTRTQAMRPFLNPTSGQSLDCLSIITRPCLPLCGLVREVPAQFGLLVVSGTASLQISTRQPKRALHLLQPSKRLSARPYPSARVSMVCSGTLEVLALSWTRKTLKSLKSQLRLGKRETAKSEASRWVWATVLRRSSTRARSKVSDSDGTEVY